MIRRPPRSPLFPYTTLFRSRSGRNERRLFRAVIVPAQTRRLAAVRSEGCGLDQLIEGQALLRPVGTCGAAQHAADGGFARAHHHRELPGLAEQGGVRLRLRRTEPGLGGPATAVPADQLVAGAVHHVLRHDPPLHQRSLRIVADHARETNRGLHHDVGQARFWRAVHVPGEEPEARFACRRTVIVHGGQRPLRDENGNEPGVLLRRSVDRFPHGGSGDRHRPNVEAGVVRHAPPVGRGGLRATGDAESRHPALHSYLHSLAHTTRRPSSPPVLKYSASVTASTGPTRTPASSDTRTRALRKNSVRGAAHPARGRARHSALRTRPRLRRLGFPRYGGTTRRSRPPPSPGRSAHWGTAPRPAGRWGP